jgi:ElaB/YqjD/DUF883 family membrane-anchored ribosome-binding protein
MTIIEFKNKVRKLIGDNDTEGAFKEMEIYFLEENKEDLLNQLTVIRATFNEIKKHETIDTISFDEAKRAKNKINAGLLNVCAEIEDNAQAHVNETKAACKAAYGLLMYLSDNTNSKAVFFEDNDKNYFLRKPQGKDFLERLPEMYLAEGHGMYLPKEVTEDLYTFRAKVYKIIDHAEINGIEGDKFQVNNPGIKKLVGVLQTRLAVNLKKSM